MGMVSEIHASDCPAFLSIRHLGLIVNGQDVYEGDEVGKWVPSFENYTLEPVGESATFFRVDAEIHETYFDLLDGQWDSALQALKTLCEEGLEGFSKITVETEVAATIEKAWNYWTFPEYVMQWNAASEDWHCPKAENDLRAGGRFIYTMAARDGSMSFDFAGTYTEVVFPVRIANLLDDGRTMSVSFSATESGRVRIEETFEAEGENSLDLQRMGWQSILDHYRTVVEASV